MWSGADLNDEVNAGGARGGHDLGTVGNEVDEVREEDLRQEIEPRPHPLGQEPTTQRSHVQVKLRKSVRLHYHEIFVYFIKSLGFSFHYIVSK